MRTQNVAKKEFKIGSFICPHTKAQVALEGLLPLAFVRWPVVVKKCGACKKKHVLECADVIHPPVYGYE